MEETGKGRGGGGGGRGGGRGGGVKGCEGEWGKEDKVKRGGKGRGEEG